jgi:hypothetical protein
MMYLQLWGRAFGSIFIFLKEKNKGCRRNPLRELLGFICHSDEGGISITRTTNRNYFTGVLMLKGIKSIQIILIYEKVS